MDFKKRLRKLIPHSVKTSLFQVARLIDPYVTFSYSQEGEDRIINRLFGSKKNGFYVDVGAHHPYRFSNTYCLKLRGWRGINVDADIDAINEFYRERKDDINLNVGISKKAGLENLYVFSDPALNTFDNFMADERKGMKQYKFMGIRSVQVDRLESILEKHIPENTEIDLLNVDVEGRDLEVLESNDWRLFKPKCIIVEGRIGNLLQLDDNPIHSYLAQHNYSLFAKTINSLIYLKN